MKFIYNMTLVKFCMALRKYHDVKIAANDTAVKTLCLQLHKKFILTAFILINNKLSQINL